MSKGARTLQGAWLLAAALSGVCRGQGAPTVPTSVAVPALRPIDVETHTPIYILTRRDLERMGDLGLGEILQRLPFMGRSAANLNSNAAGDGAVVADIGGMGPARCIVLLDGQRLPVNDLMGAPAVDLDTIPVAAIDRVEIFLGGASPAWGADAVTGVINIITRPETQGTDVMLAGARSSRGDGDTERLSVFKGEVFGSGHFNLTGELRSEEPIAASARSFSAQSQALGCLSGPGCVWPYGSTATPNGQFVVPAGNALGLPAGDYTFTTPGQWRPFVASGPVNDLYSTQTDAFLRDGRRGGSVAASLGLDLTPRTELTVEVLASTDRIERQLAPLPIDTTLTSGSPILEALTPSAAASPEVYATQIPVSAGSYYNPFGVTLSDVDLRLVGLGPRQLQDDSNTEFFSSSLRRSGEVWDWDATFTAGRSAITESDSDVIDSAHLALALGPSGPGTDGVIECGTPSGPTQTVVYPIAGCVPLDAFEGPAGITPAMLSYITSAQTDEVSQLQLQLGLIGRRSLVISPDLPPARLALGLESLHTTEHSSTDPGGSLFTEVAPPPTGGTVYENDLLTELSWPLLSSSLVGAVVTLTTGGRLAWVQDNDPVPVGFAALEWRPDPRLLLRTRFTQVYRAPTASELFLGYQERVLPLSNPCAGGAAVSAFCGAAGPVPAVTPAASESDYFIAGNPHLRPERGFSTGAGIVWNSVAHPEALASLDVTWVRLDDAIREPAALELILACETGTSPAACARIAATPGSNLYAVDGSFINGGRDESATLDLKLGDAWQSGFGELRAEALAGYLLSRKVTDISGQTLDLRGTFDLTQSVTGTAYPLVLSQAHVDWTRGPWEARWSTDFIGSYRETVDRNGFLTATGGEVRTVGSTIYHDVTLQRTWAALALRFSVENAFDHDPPRVNNGLEDNTDAATYRLEGRMFSLTLECTF